MSVYVVIVRWSKNISIIFISFELLMIIMSFLDGMIIMSWTMFEKKKGFR
jgi:hypothetical protein